MLQDVAQQVGNQADEALMGRIGVGDKAAFRELVDRHLSRATRLAYRITNNRSDAEELVQEAFLRVWTTAPRWRVEGALFRTWFSRVLVNLCIDRKRRPDFAPLEAAGERPDERIGAEAQLLQDEEAKAVGAAMAELPERQRAALALCYWDGMSNMEAAEVMSLSVGAVESLLVRARRNLKAQLAPKLGRKTEENK